MGTSSRQRLLCILDVHLSMSSQLWLCSAFRVVAFVYFLVFPLPILPIWGRRGLSSIVFSIELTAQCDGCLIWELGGARGWVAGRVGLWGVPPTWVWVAGFSLQILEHPTSIGDTGFNCGQIWCWNVGWSFSYSAACSMDVVWFLCTIFCHWVNLFACSFNARLVWRERTGQAMKSHMLVDEIGNPKASV